MKQNNMKSCMDTHEFQPSLKPSSKPEENQEKKFVVDKSTKAKDLVKLQNESRVLGGDPAAPAKEIEEGSNLDVVYDFDIKGLDNQFEENKFKRFCSRKGYHLVDFKPKLNNIMNTVSEEGRLKIRGGIGKTCEEMQEVLKDLGVDVEVHKEKHNKKNNFLYVNNLDWKEGNLAIEEKRLHGKGFVNAKQSKMNDLESNGEMFGNTEGVGKWDADWKTKKQQECLK